jgi:hypothetical protein
MVRILVALLALVIVGCPQWVRAQADADTSATTYFLEEPPAAIDRSKLPATARDVLVAKVRIVGRVVYLGGRHPWDPPQPRPKTVLGAEVEILDVLSGSAVKSTRHIVVFLERGSGQRHKYPHVPKAYERDYFIVSYLNEENARQLAGFPEDAQRYEQWDRERWEFERERSRPGAVDR